MNSRRQFLIHAPLGLAGVLTACKTETREPSAANATAGIVKDSGTVATTATIENATSTHPAPLLANVPSSAPVLTYIPKHEELVYTFGGAAPKHHITSGTRIVAWTEDCFDGAVKTSKDLPSKVMTAGHDNPQTGPFFLDGAEPGDTIAVHILKLEPALWTVRGERRGRADE